MSMKCQIKFLLSIAFFLLSFTSDAICQQLQRLTYNNPGLLVDMAVGLRGWPLPMDYNGNGLPDLVVVSCDIPYDGVYLFENTGRIDQETNMPIFTSGKRLGDARRYLRPDERLDRAANIRISYVNGRPVILSPGKAYPDFRNSVLAKPEMLSVKLDFHRYDRFLVRANQWQYIDYNENGVSDLVAGIGYWGDYRGGSYDDLGQWNGGPLRGFVYLMLNSGTNDNPVYDSPRKLKTTDGSHIEVFGWPSPNFSDFTNDGRMDLICGEFRDGFTFFKNVGTRHSPLFAPGRPLTFGDKRLTMDLCMIIPVAYDFNSDGFMDLVVGDEAGRIALVKNTGEVVDGLPGFLPPKYFKQEAFEINFGALSTPVGYDWNGDGRDDIIAGNSEGLIGYFENLGGIPQKWAAPKLLTVGEDVIRITAGPNGSIQGPAEEKWGYTSLTVADWDHDEHPDLIVNSIWGKVIWYKNIGSRNDPELAPARPVEVAWKGNALKPAWNWWDPKGNSLVSQWRTTPVAIDWNSDGLTDLVMLDHEGYLGYFRRAIAEGKVVLLPGERIFRLEGEPELLRLNNGKKGSSGRRKIAISDFDGDGRLDLLVNSASASFYKNIGEDNGITVFRDMGPLDEQILAGHSTSPSVIDLTEDGVPELLIGGEDGFIYYKNNPFID